MSRNGRYLICLLAVLIVAPAYAQGQRRRERSGLLPPPDLANVSYGPDKLNVMDVWLAKSLHPAPLLLFIHGGGFRRGDKSQLSPGLLAACRRMGVTVASVNYRLSPEVAFPTHYMDCARALQFARYSAHHWNIDPRRVILTGGSAGAGTSLWIAFHDDMADPKSNDPVARQSTRVSAVLVTAAQTTYDPRVIKKIIGGRAAEHSALLGFWGLKPDELDTPKAHEIYEKCSPINYLTKDDPPVFAFYMESKAPLKPDSPPGAGIHHPNFGYFLKDKMDALGIECIIRLREEDGNDLGERMAFLRKHFGLTRGG